MYNQLTSEDLGFVMAIDGCARGCGHCPAYGLGMRPTVAKISELRERLSRIRAAMPNVNFATEFRTIHSWRISDLADYYSTEDGVSHDMVSVAEVWTACLGQPLYVVTNGTIGSKRRRESLQLLAQHPELVSQVKLTITPFDPKFRLGRYVENMAFDVATLWQLGELSSQRYESLGKGQRRLRINVKAASQQHDEVVEMLNSILHEAGLSSDLIRRLLKNEDPRLQIKPVYDLRVSEQQPIPDGALTLGGSVADRLKHEMVRQRMQLGIRTDGRAFAVDLHNFSEHDLLDENDQPCMFSGWFS